MIVEIDDIWEIGKPYKEVIAEYCELLVEEQFKDIKTRLDVIELKLDVEKLKRRMENEGYIK